MAKTSGFMAEFKKFIMRGNVIDLAVGVIVGGAFQAIVKSLVDDIVMPVILQQSLLLLTAVNMQLLKKLRQQAPQFLLTATLSAQLSTSSLWLSLSSALLKASTLSAKKQAKKKKKLPQSPQQKFAPIVSPKSASRQQSAPAVLLIWQNNLSEFCI